MREPARPTRWLVTSGALLATAAAALAIVPLASRARDADELRPAPAPAAAPAPAPQSESITASGYVVAERSAHVGPRFVGRLESVLVAEGDRVQVGAVLARLDRAPEAAGESATFARFTAAQARLRTAQAAALEVEHQLEREQDLAARGVTPRAVAEDLSLRLQTLQMESASAAADVGAARAEVRKSSADVSGRDIVAPIAGVVVGRPLSPGEVVGLPGSPPVLELVDFDSLVLELDVPERYLSSLRPAAEADVTFDAFPNQSFRAKLKDFGKRIDRSKSTALVRFTLLSPAPAVLPNMAGQARISLAQPRPTHE